MGTLAIPELGGVSTSRLEAEREECEWLLTSGALGRSGNLTRVLRYVCEEYFSGRADHIKEYTIAVDALGRRPEFDPQTDTIVRVTVHALRKRLIEVYEAEDRPVHLVLPPGHYAPSFVHPRSTERRPMSHLQDHVLSPADAGLDWMPAVAHSLTGSRQAVRREVPIAAARILIAVAITGAALGLWWWSRAAKRARPVEAAIVSNGLPLPLPQTTIHALMGNGRAPYADRSGVTWTSGNYCRSGTSVNLPAQHMEGTEDAPLYLGGVRGIVHCAFPVPQGMYEVHLHFSDTSLPDTSDLPVSTRDASITLNSGATRELKIVDEAGGYSTALSIFMTGVARENDGAIHLDYVSEVSLLNAVEILPAQSVKQLPVRIAAGSKAFTDDAKQVWGSDRYFNGGRHGQQLKLANPSNLGVYQASRVGRFQYNIPAVPLAHYRIRLYFRDPWFGKDNGSSGGPGSRIFNVACNGILLLKDFDILAEGDSKPVAKTFENVQANAAGRIELYFMPVVNYAEISAIEVVPED